MSGARENVVESTSSVLVEAFADEVSPSALTFVKGEREETLTLGKSGLWRLAGAGVADVHAILHFDGADLFVCSHAAAPVQINGQAIATQCVRLTLPATIELGAARLSIREAEPKHCEQSSTMPAGNAEPATDEANDHHASQSAEATDGDEEPLLSDLAVLTMRDYYLNHLAAQPGMTSQATTRRGALMTASMAAFAT